MIFQALFYSVLLIVLIIFLLDLIPIFKDWLQRIHLGRFENYSVWNQALTKQGTKWLLHTPKVRVTDNTRFIVIDMVKGNYTKKYIQHWQEATLILGLSEYLSTNEEHHVKQAIKVYLGKKFDSSGQWIEKPEFVDAAILAYAVLKLDFIDSNQYKAAYDYTWNLIKEHIGKDGTVEYRKHMKSYRYVDTVGFICPFLVAYGLRYDKDECIDLAIKQIKEYENYGLLKDFRIPCHVYKIENKVPLGQYGWGRGLGWYAIGLIDAWNELPWNNKYKPQLEESIKKFAKTVNYFQQENGSWNWTVTRKEARADSSATATLGWFLLRASQIKEISTDCLISAERAFHYLMQVTRRNGAVDFSQGDTRDIGVYSSLFTILPFTQGFCLRTINYFLNQQKASKDRLRAHQKEVLYEDNRVYSNLQ